MSYRKIGLTTMAVTQDLHSGMPLVLSIHTEKCLVGFTIRWLMQLHDLVIYKATTYLVVVTFSDSCNDLGITTI